MEILQTRDTCVDRLSETEGQPLEIMANLRSSQQLSAVMEGYVAAVLGSAYGVNKYQMLLRCTVSWQARGRDDLTAIGKASESGWNPQEGGEK